MRTGTPGGVVIQGAFVPLDTDRPSHDLQLELYRRLGGTERAAIMFRLSDSSASKIDLIIRKDRPFSHEEFGPGVLSESCGGRLSVA